jgi:AAA domain-containing protein
MTGTVRLDGGKYEFDLVDGEISRCSQARRRLVCRVRESVQQVFRCCDESNLRKRGEDTFMIDLKRISKGKQVLHPRVLIYSFEGIGKTRFAAGAPDPFFLDYDRGSHKYDVARVTPESWGETKEWLKNIETGAVKCQTVVLDSVTFLEPVSHAEIFAGTSIEQWEGGFNKGEGYAVTRWKEELIQPLERLWLTGKSIVLVAHATVKTFNDPSGPSYERFTVGMRPKLADYLKQWADYVFFAREELVAVTDKKRSRATTTGTRFAYTRRTPAYDAKARGTLLFPERFLLSWDEFASAMASEKTRSNEMMQGIEAMLAELSDPELTKKVLDWIRQNPDNLVDASQAVQARLDAARSAKEESQKTTQAASPNGS